MKNRASWLIGCVMVLISCVPAAVWAQEYSVEGPEAYTVFDLPAIGNANGGKLVVPDGSGPYPLLVTSHGWASGPNNQIGWARHFASYGFIAVVPAFPNPMSPNHSKNGDIIVELVDYFSDPPEDSPAAGKVDPARIGLEGHSAGGLASTLGAAKIQPAAIVLFDPVENAGLGREALSAICGPVLSIFTTKSGCNSNGNWVPNKNESIGPTYSFYVEGATHCDGENEPRGLCGAFCGGAANEERQAQFGHYATAFFLNYLLRDSTAEAEFTEAALNANGALTDVSVTLNENCVELDPPDLTDGDADVDGDGDGDGDSDGDIDGDTDGDIDGDADGDGDSAGDGDSDGDGDAAGEEGCSCRAVGAASHLPQSSLRQRFLSLLPF